MSHPGVTCDGCNDTDFTGIRYNCHVCDNYDLCGNCVAQGVTSKSHREHHPLRQILPAPLDEGAFGLSGSGYSRRGRPSDFQFYGGYTPSELFACPYCGADGMIEEALVTHVLSIHSDEDRSMVCPICASRPGGDPNYVSADFLSHLDLRHRGGSGRSRRGGISVRGRRTRRDIDSDVSSYLDSSSRGGFRGGGGGGGGFFFGDNSNSSNAAIGGDSSGSSAILRNVYRHEDRKRSHKSSSKSKSTPNAQLTTKRAIQAPLSEAERKERDISRMMKSVFLQELITSTLLEATSPPSTTTASPTTTPSTATA